MLQPQFKFEGLLHDAAEAYIGDISTPMKWLMQKYSAGITQVIERIETVVQEAFGIKPGHNLNVKAADGRMLATEAKAFMVVDATEWGLALPYDNVNLEHPFTAKQARDIFLETYYSLAQKDNPIP